MASSELQKYTGCGAIIFRQQDDKVFVAQRKLSKPFGGGLWETVGGGIEQQDKSFVACIKREIREELNAGIKSAEAFKDYRIVATGNKSFLIKIFVVELDSEPNPNNNDFEKYGWFNKDEIKKLEFVSNCKERLLEYYSLKKDAV